jgi:hypothetical protein
VGAEKSTRNTVAKIAAKQVAMESDWESEEFRSDSRWLEFQKHLQKIERDL